jgi:tetratricopeptide (TPR) repeat protein
MAYAYWLPSVIDLSTRADKLVYRQEAPVLTMPEPARDRLRTSAGYFEKACSADRTYAPSRVNLSVAYFYLEDIYKARAAVEEALALDPEDAEAGGLRAIVMVHEAPDVDMWPYAINQLKALSERADAPAAALYNLAVLLEKRKRTGEARAVWERLASRTGEIPGVYEGAVCDGIGARVPVCLHAEPRQPPALPWPLPVQIGSDLLKQDSAGRRIKNWEKIEYDWQNRMIRGHIYISPGGSSVLAVNDFVEMVVLKGDDFGTMAALVGKCGRPWHQTDVYAGELWSYGPKWSVLVKDGKISEVWVSE